MVDLGVCIEGIRRAIVYGRGILEYREHPRKVNKSYARISTEGFVEALKAIADNCPLPDYKRKELLDEYRKLKTYNWESIADWVLTQSEITRLPDDALSFLRDYVGYIPEKYEEYIPEYIP